VSLSHTPPPPPTQPSTRAWPVARSSRNRQLPEAHWSSVRRLHIHAIWRLQSRASPACHVCPPCSQQIWQDRLDCAQGKWVSIWAVIAALTPMALVRFWQQRRAAACWQAVPRDRSLRGSKTQLYSQAAASCKNHRDLRSPLRHQQRVQPAI